MVLHAESTYGMSLLTCSIAGRQRIATTAHKDYILSMAQGSKQLRLPPPLLTKASKGVTTAQSETFTHRAPLT
eukprot:1161403-Pelagomonas_calceolata.AAC.1